MPLLSPIGRALVALGWILVAAATFTLATHILFGHFRAPWETYYELVAQPTYLAVVAFGWWLLGAATVTTGGAGAAARGLIAFAVVSLIQGSTAVVGLVSPFYPLSPVDYRVDQWLTLFGALLAVAGFVVSARTLRAAVLDLPGVVGDVVSDLAQGEPEGPAPVGPAGP